ncbi:hypothetical protein N0K08_04880 [Acidovorax sp. Be4]|uniref:Uncharacterized protein n=1 Tax=Acidovorax bellezanensis TaxID=2976702 RepID=A0ABT2PL05_9BURK|nr:hypothetical protein [Acidovorax sp. Be4]MCT9809957.1 hypothetical protein [Acidovorax sp. Be4]
MKFYIALRQGLSWEKCNQYKTIAPVIVALAFAVDEFFAKHAEKLRQRSTRGQPHPWPAPQNFPLQ